MDKKELKSKFSEYLKQEGESPKKLDETVKRFGKDIFDIFLDGLENYRKNPRYYNYKKVFNEIVLPQMKLKAEKLFGDIYFRPDTYEKYQSLFVNFMMFARRSSEYINGLMLEKRKENLEKSVEGKYGNHFNKKALIHAWHNYIQTDEGVNGDKLRGYLADIYGDFNNEGLKQLYDILFDSYEICSRITNENHENKGKENFERNDAFEDAFSNLKSNLGKINDDILTKIKSLFGKYLNFVPRYREKLINAIKGKPEKGGQIQKETETSLIGVFSKNENTEEESTSVSGSDNEPINHGIEGDGFGPIKVVSSSRDENVGVYDQTERGDIIAPIDYGIFPNSDSYGKREDEED